MVDGTRVIHSTEPGLGTKPSKPSKLVTSQTTLPLLRLEQRSGCAVAHLHPLIKHYNRAL